MIFSITHSLCLLFWGLEFQLLHKPCCEGDTLFNDLSPFLFSRGGTQLGTYYNIFSSLFLSLMPFSSRYLLGSLRWNFGPLWALRPNTRLKTFLTRLPIFCVQNISLAIHFRFEYQQTPIRSLHRLSKNVVRLPGLPPKKFWSRISILSAPVHELSSYLVRRLLQRLLQHVCVVGPFVVYWISATLVKQIFINFNSVVHPRWPCADHTLTLTCRSQRWVTLTLVARSLSARRRPTTLASSSSSSSAARCLGERGAPTARAQVSGERASDRYSLSERSEDRQKRSDFCIDGLDYQNLKFKLDQF